MRTSIIMLLLFLTAPGCAAIREQGKAFWGSSTKDLERARESALVGAFRCEVAECFDRVLQYAALPYLESTSAPAMSVLPGLKQSPKKQEQNFLIFQKDLRRGMIVLMNVPGHVNTTEVGVFISAVEGGASVELSSLSTSAKTAAARMIFDDLSAQFQQISSY